MVDTLGLIIAVLLHGAYWEDYEGACYLLTNLEEVGPRIRRIYADSAYGRDWLPDWFRESNGRVMQTVLRPDGVSGFVVIPKFWIVERTFAWLVHYHRHARDYSQLQNLFGRISRS